MNREYHIIGIMSGTSLDGLDLVKCIFDGNDLRKYQIETCETIPYSEYWKNTLRHLHIESIEKIEEVNIKYGQLLAKHILSFIKRNNIKYDYISSHGHTIIHQPNIGRTLQIGDGQTIANITGVTTINNFRSLDVSLGGQGAPLVPIGDILLFPQYKYCLNLGGFANISIKQKNKKITAFDICPVNFILNYLSEKKGEKFDNKGIIAKSGNLKTDLLKELNDIPFYNNNIRTSLSREWVENIMMPILEYSKHSTEDKMRTFCEHIAIQISKNLQDRSVLITGGGALNEYLIERISFFSESKIIKSEIEIINYKEAVIFALLGILRLRNENNCLSAVTGAKRDCSGGDVFEK